MIKKYLVDSNIWHYAYIIPEKEDWKIIHQKAAYFLEEILLDSQVVIVMSEYQIAEIMELFRKGSLPAVSRRKIFDGIQAPKFETVPVDMSSLQSAFQKSLQSNIHIYDYLVALPLKGKVDTLFSADDHFRHRDFQDIAKVINPLSPWILREGKDPFLS